MLDSGWRADSRYLTGSGLTLADFAAYVELGQLQPRFLNLFDFAPFPNVGRCRAEMQQVRGHDDVHTVLTELSDISGEPPNIDRIKGASKAALLVLRSRLDDMAR